MASSGWWKTAPSNAPNVTLDPIETLLSRLVLLQEAGVCDQLQEDSACLSLLTEVFERAREWVSNDPVRTGLLLKACIAGESDLPKCCADPDTPEPVRVASSEACKHC
jgi:hypothetical protein